MLTNLFFFSAPNVTPEVVYHATNNDMCCMSNFVSYLNNLQKIEIHAGALKIIPPEEWTALHNFEETMFDYLKVVPKVQSTTKLVEGIMQLCNNPLRDVGSSKSEIQLRVNKIFKLLFSICFGICYK